MGDSDAVEESAVGAGDGTTGCGGGEAGRCVLCRDGRNKAAKPSRVTLMIAARMRRRFTRSSKALLLNVRLTNQ
jgi:hypothetical protein